MTTRIAVLISGRGSNLGALLDAQARRCSSAARSSAVHLQRARGGRTRASPQTRGIADGASWTTRPSPSAARSTTRSPARIDADAPDLVVLAGFMRVLGTGVRRALRGPHAQHPSRRCCPSFPGLHTHRRALADGVRVHGCTVHFVTPDVDVGPDRRAGGGAGARRRRRGQPRRARAGGRACAAAAGAWRGTAAGGSAWRAIVSMSGRTAPRARSCFSRPMPDAKDAASTLPHAAAAGVPAAPAAWEAGAPTAPDVSRRARFALGGSPLSPRARRVLWLALVVSLALHLALTLWPVSFDPEERGHRPQDDAHHAAAASGARGAACAASRARSPPARRRIPVTPAPAPVALPTRRRGAGGAGSRAVTSRRGRGRARRAAGRAPPVEAPPAEIASPKTLPPRVDLAYKVFWGTQGFEIGEAVYRFEHKDNRYRIATVGQARGLAALVLRGQGKLEGTGAITPRGPEARSCCAWSAAAPTAWSSWPSIARSGIVTLRRRHRASAGGAHLRSALAHVAVLLHATHQRRGHRRASPRRASSWNTR